MPAAANSMDCMNEFVGGTIVGALSNAFGEGTKTFLFLGGRAFTFTSKGAFWEEASTKVQQFIENLKKQVATDQKLLDSMAEHAPWGS